MLKLGNKRGISEVIAYVLLIGITVSISMLVYNWLIFEVTPADKPVCPNGVSLSIRDVYCGSATQHLEFSVKNNGLFGVDGYYVVVNDREDSDFGIFQIGLEKDVVAPGSEISRSYEFRQYVDRGKFSSDLKLLEVRPFVFVDGVEASCQSTITTLDCSLQLEDCTDSVDNDGDIYVDCDDVEDCRYLPVCSSEDDLLNLHLTFDNIADYLEDLSSQNNVVTVSATGRDNVGQGGSGGLEFTNWNLLEVNAEDVITGNEFTTFFWVELDTNADTKFLWIDDYIQINSVGVIGSPKNFLEVRLGDNDDNNFQTPEDSFKRYDKRFIALVYEEGEKTALYIDGEKAGESENTVDLSSFVFAGKKFNIGSFLNFEGYIDEVRIYDSALSSDEVEDLYESYL